MYTCVCLVGCGFLCFTKSKKIMEIIDNWIIDNNTNTVYIRYVYSTMLQTVLTVCSTLNTV